MGHADGADIPAAITEIQQAGWSVKRLAGDLAVHPSSLYRWRNGTRTPNKANFAALVQLAEMEYAAENCRPGTRGVVLVHLQRAYELLETDTQRAAEQAKADELASRMEAAEQRRLEAESARLAEARAFAAEHRRAQRDRISAAVAAAEGRVSVHADTDPFVVFNNSAELAVAERAFA